ASEDKEEPKKAAVIIGNIPDAPDTKILLDPMPQLPYTIPGSEIQITEITYFDAAVVRENRLVNDPSDGRFNPAVEVTFRNKSGFTEKHTKFFLFPDFESMHGKKSSNSMDLDVSLDVPVPPQHRKEKPGFIVRFLNGEWSYQVKGSKDRSDFIKVSEGDTVSTGWMDMQITIESLIEHAAVSSEVVPAEGDEKQFYGANLSLTSEEGTVTQWALPHRPAVFTTDGGPVTASVSISSHKLPFALVLNDFRKVDYPGTQEAMSFESDVTLVDSIHNRTISKTIKMNEPMDYAGFRIFQSSYIQDPEHGEASVFTIAKNPGLFFQYSGAIILTLGVLILFYVKPLSVFTRVHGDIK
ncbi:MAG: cytochrome c biogenesis protein ResB, partial [Candidatus Omnitrophica bacterium]|nr:cytochrome c biogenesis protein ResB [Candidatus Omnitrophota bacterium]